jgi:MscS family membrane protein
MPISPLRRAQFAAFVIAIGLAPVGRPSYAQGPRPGTAQAAQAGPSAPMAMEDPLRRETPRGAFLGFVEAAQRGDRATAAEYLQWPHQRMPITREEAADQLRFILNHGFEGNLDRLSRDPAGSSDDGLDANRERVGAAVLANGERVDIFLERVAQAAGPPIWLVSADTVADIPRMYEHAGLPEIERRLPKILTASRFGELQLWVPLALLLLLPFLYAVVKLFLWTVVEIYRLAARRWKTSPPVRRSRGWVALSRPTAFLGTLALHRLISPQVGIPLIHRQYYSRTITILFLLGVVWWLWRMVDLVAERMRDRLQPDHPRTAQSVYVLGRRLLKGVALIIALLAGLAAFGVDLTATLTGLGIGGVALAFASQKTLENVFGGIFVLSDRSIVVGDFCQIGKYTGEVADVGLRSMQLRTVNRTVVYVPNGTLATMEVENLSRRDKFLFNPTISLRYETTLEQIQRVRDGVMAELTADGRVEDSTLRVRFARFAASSLDIDVFAYVKAPDYPAFLGVQEALLMRIMGIVQQAGTSFAFPSRTMYVRPDSPAQPALPVKLNDS